VSHNHPLCENEETEIGNSSGNYKTFDLFWLQSQSSFFVLFCLFRIFFPLLLCWVGVHYSIYKVSFSLATISHLNSPFPPGPLYPPLPQFMEQFQQVSCLHSYACVHIFARYLAPTPAPHHHPYPTGANLPPLSRTCSALLFSNFAEEKREKRKRKTWHFC
jgi:hypothetical protein